MGERRKAGNPAAGPHLRISDPKKPRFDIER
jgi:hypothetical protein